MDKSDLLIDFNSPVQKNELRPLIPIPPQMSLAPKEIVELSHDPFEIREIEAPDPFESVLQRAGNSSNSEVAEDRHTSPNKEDEGSKTQNESFDGGRTKSPKLGNHNNSFEPVSSLSCVCVETIPHNQNSSTNEILNGSPVDFENPNTAVLVDNKAQEIVKNTSKSSVILENDNESQISADFSTEESLKKVIARRVNRCIQDVLNGSLKSKTNSDKPMFKKPQNKRSLSFIGLTTVLDKKECDRLNKSCTDVNDTFDLENQQLDASSDTSGFGCLSQNSTDVSVEGDADPVFVEARKLSRTFSKLAESFRQEQDQNSDDEDLLSCKPRWLYTESSEDEEEKLLKDPSLNLRRRSDSSAFSSPASKPSKVLDSPALLAYKSRRSFTQLPAAHNNTQEELNLKRSISIGSHFREAPTIPTLPNTVPINLVKTDDQPIKLRKKNFGDTKKGPLRAVMPVQSMTKEPLPIAGKLPSKQDLSPEARTQKSVYALGTPSKDNSQLNIPPMACSTPNKSESFVSSSGIASLLKPTAPTVVNKRHSLEGNVGGHKSRGAIPEVGPRPRSNSANSSIPRVFQVKPLKGLPLAPKSASNLIRPTNTQINGKIVKNVPEKKITPQLKSKVNARVLTEVKTKSPCQSKVRTAVNAISHFVRGKKTAARDKENRVPM